MKIWRNKKNLIVAAFLIVIIAAGGSVALANYHKTGSVAPTSNNTKPTPKAPKVIPPTATPGSTANTTTSPPPPSPAPTAPKSTSKTITPSPVPPPAPPTFAVTLGVGTASDPNPNVYESDTFTFPVTASTAGTITYKIVDSEGNIFSSSSLTFGAAGTQSIALVYPFTGSWISTTSRDDWVQLQVLTPTTISSNQVVYHYNNPFAYAPNKNSLVVA